MARRTSVVGQKGETAVAEWYVSKGYQLLARNWRCPVGEIDLILMGDGGDVVVFCEVKTRLSGAFGSPLEAVTVAKRRRMRKLAGLYMAQGRPPGLNPLAMRVDVAAVRAGPSGTLDIEVVEDAC